MGTIGRITAYDISQSFDFTNSIERSLPVKWTNQAYEVSRSGKYHNTAFCLHYDRPILFSAFVIPQSFSPFNRLERHNYRHVF